jgi:hypothetical protein
VALVGVPDGASPASTHLDVPASLPLSARVHTGVRWTEGDVLGVQVTVRNRLDHPVRASVTASARGVATLTELRPGGEATATRMAEIPAGSAGVVTFSVTAKAQGSGELSVKVQAPGAPADIVHHTWQVLPAGEPTTLVSAAWVLGRGSLVAAGGDATGLLPTGGARVVLERGFPVALSAAIESLDPDRIDRAAGLVDAIEVGERVRRWAVAAEGERSALAARAKGLIDRAWGRFEAGYHRGSGEHLLTLARWLMLVDADRAKATLATLGEKKNEPFCPDAEHPAPTGLDAEPPPNGGRVSPCWDAFVSSKVAEVTKEGDAEALALAFLALAERPHRTALAAAVMARLREVTKPLLSGEIQGAQDRSARAILYAALLRGAALVPPTPVPPELLAAWIGVLRDSSGGYGSSAATRSVVRALLGSALEENGLSQVKITSGAFERTLAVPGSGRLEVPLPANAMAADVEVTGPGVIARLERPVVRLWSRAADTRRSPLHLDVRWPDDARAGQTGTVTVLVQQGDRSPEPLEIRLPLPPGAHLAERLPDVREIQGVLQLRREVDASATPTPIVVPVRFELAGHVTIPEADVRVRYTDIPRAVAPARALTIE